MLNKSTWFVIVPFESFAQKDRHQHFNSIAVTGGSVQIFHEANLTISQLNLLFSQTPMVLYDTPVLFAMIEIW